MKVEISTYQSYNFDISSKNEKISGKNITDFYLASYLEKSLKLSSEDIFKQSNIFSLSLEDIGYTGKAIDDLSQEEAKELVSENGFFGITNTSNRIAQFVIATAADDLDKLKAGKEGMLRGFQEAEDLWGSKLPDISQQTMQKAIKMVDDKIAELGGQVLDITS